MSERLTTEWTKTAEGAFGPSGAKGLKGEVFVKQVLESWGWNVILHEADQTKQLAGIDIEFQSPKWKRSYSADVKSNIDSYGTFYIETDDKGWLFNPSKISHRIWHCNPTTGQMAWYDRQEMQKYIVDNNMRNRGLYRVSGQHMPFVTRRTVEV